MSDFRTPIKNARGLGSAKTGTEHFVHQRLTATALVALTIWFLVFVLSLSGADDDHVVLVFGDLVSGHVAQFPSAMRATAKTLTMAPSTAMNLTVVCTARASSEL